MRKPSQFLHTGTGSKTRYTQGKPSADAKIARDEFLAHRKEAKKNERPHKLTPIQRRMQSGGPA